MPTHFSGVSPVRSQLCSDICDCFSSRGDSTSGDVSEVPLEPEENSGVCQMSPRGKDLENSCTLLYDHCAGYKVGREESGGRANSKT